MEYGHGGDIYTYRDMLDFFRECETRWDCRGKS